MKTPTDSPAHGRQAGHATHAASAPGKPVAQGGNAAGGAQATDAFASLMQALTDGLTDGTATDGGAEAGEQGDPAAQDAATGDRPLATDALLPALPAQPAQPAQDAAAVAAATVALPLSLVPGTTTGVGAEPANDASTATPSASQGLTAGSAAPRALDISPGAQAITPASTPGSRGLAGTPPGDAQGPAFAAAVQAAAGEARPRGPDRLAAASGASAAGATDGAARTPAASSLAGPAGRPGLSLSGAEEAARQPPVASLIAQLSATAPDERRRDEVATPSTLSLSNLDAAAALSGSLPPAVPTAGPIHQAELASRPQDASFAGELAAQVDVMVQGDLQSAELRLNPVDLGPIRIELRLDGNTADVSFTAAHDQTREGISQSLEHLRDMLASQGLQLGQANVGARHAGQDQADHPSQPARAPRSSSGSGISAVEAAPAASRPRALRGMLDLYA